MNKLIWFWLFSSIILTSCSSHRPSSLPAEEISPPENTPTATPQLPPYTSTSLELSRNGKQYRVFLGYDWGDVLFRVTPEPDQNISDLFEEALNVRLANIEWYGDLDADGETEYLVTVLGRGAYSYEIILAIDYDAAKDEFRIFDRIGFRSSAFDRWDDLEGDGIPEMVAKDEGFHYESGGGGADAVFSPLKIFHYNGEKFVSVTQDYPELIEQDAQGWLESIENDADGQGQFGSIYAAYLADMYLLGKKEEGIQVFWDKCMQRYIPYLETQNPESTLSCDEFLFRIQEALAKSGYE